MTKFTIIWKAGTVNGANGYEMERRTISVPSNNVHQTALKETFRAMINEAILQGGDTFTIVEE